MRERLRVVLYVGGGEGGGGGGGGRVQGKKNGGWRRSKRVDLFLTIYRNVKNSILTT